MIIYKLWMMILRLQPKLRILYQVMCQHQRKLEYTKIEETNNCKTQRREWDLLVPRDKVNTILLMQVWTSPCNDAISLLLV